MDKKQMYVQVINLNTGKIFSLPTLYTDRTEACICGQNYIRDRQAENFNEILFFRVLYARENGEVAPEHYLWDDQLEEEEEEEEDNCDGECERCGLCCEDEDSEEPALESLAEILSAFSTVRPNY